MDRQVPNVENLCFKGWKVNEHNSCFKLTLPFWIRENFVRSITVDLFLSNDATFLFSHDVYYYVTFKNVDTVLHRQAWQIWVTTKRRKNQFWSVTQFLTKSSVSIEKNWFDDRQYKKNDDDFSFVNSNLGSMHLKSYNIYRSTFSNLIFFVRNN